MGQRQFGQTGAQGIFGKAAVVQFNHAAHRATGKRQRLRTRGKGFGLALWNEALMRKPARAIGLDGVKAQQPSYRKSGFVLAHENIRHGGLKPGGYAQNDDALTPLSAADAVAIDRFEQLDQRHDERQRLISREASKNKSGE